MNHGLQRAGAAAALYEAIAYIVGFVVLFAFLTPAAGDAAGPAQRLAFLLEHRALFQVWNLVIYVGFGAALVVLAIALHQRLQAGAPGLMPIATAFGLIWSALVIASGMIANVGLDAVATIQARDPLQAASVWLAVGAVQNGMGGGVEFVGGVWVVLVSRVARRARALPGWLNALGFVVGIAGIATVVPAFDELGMVFGLGQIAWFAALGGVLLRDSRAAART